MPKEWSYELLCSDCDVIAIITIEPDLALTKLEEAVMWANAGIARNE